MRIYDTDSDNTFLTPLDKYNKINNEQIIIYARSGYSKGCVSEGLVEWYHKHGYLIMVIADPKHEVEYGYQMFKPREKYHLEHLNIISEYVGKWKTPSRKNVQLYHPFTQNIPTNKKIPKMNVFTVPIKSLGRAEWGLLSEVHGENETVSVLLKASEEITNEDGTYSFAHYVQDSVKGKLKGKEKKPDWNNFGLEATSGTMKEVSKISNILRPFKKHSFLSKQNSPYNLDWKSVLTNQSDYHVFVNNYIGRSEEKVTDFMVLYLLENIIKNKNYLKTPVLIVIPEISYLCPFKPSGHKEFLANSIKRNLKTIRSEGRGMSTILDSQVFGDVDEDVRGSSTISFFGELGDVKDIENISKALGWNKKIKEELNKADIPRTYLIRGVEGHRTEEGAYLMFYSSAMHCESGYNFDEMYREHSEKEPERYPLVSYKEMSETIKRFLKEDEEKMRKKVKRRQKELEELEEKKKREKEERTQENAKEETEKKTIKVLQDKNKEQLMKSCFERYNNPNLENKEKTFRQIAVYLGIKSHKTVAKYIQEYEEKIKKEKEQNLNVDFEDKVLEELNS